MLSVVIVEDEALSRTELKSMVDWQAEGFYILGEAENGKKGLELILRDRPDLVITDVKMPVMDGLEMIRLARQEYDGARYVVLSSYGEFGLLKTAMHCGVADYLLKLECSAEALRGMLAAQKAALLRDRSGEEARAAPPLARAAHLLRRILAGERRQGELAPVLLAANPAIDPRRLACAAVLLSLPSRADGFDDEDRRTMGAAAHSIVHDIAKQFFPGVSCQAGPGLFLCLFTPGEEDGAVEEMCGVILNMLRQYLNREAAVGLAEGTGPVEEAAALLEEAVRATGEVFYRGYGRVLRAPDPAGPSPEEAAPPAYNWSEPLLRALELRDGEAVRTAFHPLEKLLTPEAGLDRAEAFNLCFSVAGLALSSLKKDGESKGLFAENLYEIIGGIDTLQGLRQWLLSFQGSILELFATLPRRTGEDSIVDQAKRYIVEHCGESIGLGAVAGHLSISAGYLSSVFKRGTGMGFVEYVTKVKMTEAKRLLLTGSYKIYEVAELVGYEDTSYFIKTFHKVTGLTPKEYLSNHL